MAPRSWSSSEAAAGEHTSAQRLGRKEAAGPFETQF